MHLCRHSCFVAILNLWGLSNFSVGGTLVSLSNMSLISYFLYFVWCFSKAKYVVTILMVALSLISK